MWGLPAAAHSQHAFEFVREDFDESEAASRPSSPESTCARGLPVSSTCRAMQIFQSAASSSFDHRFQIDASPVASFCGELAVSSST